MTKKQSIKAGKHESGKQGSKGPVSDTQDPTTQDPTTGEIKTVEDLESLYPQLVSEVRDEVVHQVESCTADQARKNLPGLYKRIALDVQSKSRPDLKVPGFLLELDDPVAAGTLRTFQSLKGVDNLRLPCVLPFKDKNTKAALVNYITRADGCGDTKRANAAREAMEKIK